MSEITGIGRERNVLSVTFLAAALAVASGAAAGAGVRRSLAGEPAPAAPETHPSCLNIPFAASVHGARSLTTDLGSEGLRDGALLEWFTDRECGVLGFNVVRLLFRAGAVGRIQLNDEPLPCHWCDNGGGDASSHLLERHRSIHNLFVEAIMADGSRKQLGPAEVK